tara:strand:- start:587 stop:715 length:129 start_codon:yes stop_codon:yes gene_type:complete
MSEIGGRIKSEGYSLALTVKLLGSRRDVKHLKDDTLIIIYLY